MVARYVYFFLAALLATTVLSGCLESAEIVVAGQSSETSFDLSHGIVYNVDVIVENVGDGEGSADVKVDLIADGTEVIRDSQTQTVMLEPGQKRQLRFILDGEMDEDYSYTIEIDQN
jgi:hypothetical protein